MNQAPPCPEDVASSDHDGERLLVARHVRRHACFGWWALLAFLTTGIALESMHGFKWGLYLDAGNETRRLMWTLGHAHGTLLALVNLIFAGSVRMAWARSTAGLRLASGCLVSASLLLPAGFLLGGVWIHGGDPGLGVVLVPIGALLLVIAVTTTAYQITRSLP